MLTFKDSLEELEKLEHMRHYVKLAARKSKGETVWRTSAAVKAAQLRANRSSSSDFVDT